MNRILVTGANGFVGQRVCRQLLASGFAVRAVVRTESAVATLDQRCEPRVCGPIESFRQWDRVLENIEGVVHLVARTHQTAERGPKVYARYHATNVLATQSLLDGCAHSGVTRLVFVSSIKAVGEGADHPYSETEDCHPEDSYGKSKQQAEQLLLNASDAVSPVILRPPLVYGPGVSGNFRRLMSAVQRGVPLPLGSISNARSLIYVDNLADAIVVALRHPRAVREIFHVADQQAVSTPELIRLLGQALGRPARLPRIPLIALRAAAGIVGKRAECRRLVDSLTLCCNKAQEVLGWRPPYSLQEGVRNTAESFVLADSSSAASTLAPREPLLQRN